MNILGAQEARETGNLELLAKQVVEGFIIGLHKSPFHGFSVEFAEHRLYNPGESTKSIDWKVYARTDKLFTKRYEEETNLRCQIILDVSSSMSKDKLWFSSLAAASLMYLLQKQRDAFGLSIFSDSVLSHTGCKSSTKHLNLLLSQLDKHLNALPLNVQTNAARCIHEISDAIHTRSLVVIFSDMFENGQDVNQLFAALQHLKYNKHEVILFHVIDKKLEEDFEFENRPYRFVDLETGEEIMLQSNQIKEHYQKQIREYKQALKLKCLQYKIDFVEADVNQDFKQILMPYLVKRAKMG